MDQDAVNSGPSSFHSVWPLSVAKGEESLVPGYIAGASGTWALPRSLAGKLAPPTANECTNP